MPSAETTRGDIEAVKQRDLEFGAHQGLLLARMRNTLKVLTAHGCRKVGAAPALRQSLIDLSAVSEQLADDMRPRS